MIWELRWPSSAALEGSGGSGPVGAGPTTCAPKLRDLLCIAGLLEDEVSFEKRWSGRGPRKVPIDLERVALGWLISLTTTISKFANVGGRIAALARICIDGLAERRQSGDRSSPFPAMCTPSEMTSDWAREGGSTCMNATGGTGDLAM